MTACSRRLWVGAILAFAEAVDPAATDDRGGRHPRWGWVVVFGLLAGWAADTKLTGWFLPLPFLAWTALYRSRRGSWTLAVGGRGGRRDPVCPQPPLVDRPDRRGRAIPAVEPHAGPDDPDPGPVPRAGSYMTPVESLPWYNTLAWTVDRHAGRVPRC